MHTVYLLQSRSCPEQFYVGLAHDPHRRLLEHNRGQSPHTAKFLPWKLLVSITFEDPNQATRFERYLKTGSGRAFAIRHFR